MPRWAALSTAGDQAGFVQLWALSLVFPCPLSSEFLVPLAPLSDKGPGSGQMTSEWRRGGGRRMREKKREGRKKTSRPTKTTTPRRVSSSLFKWSFIPLASPVTAFSLRNHCVALSCALLTRQFLVLTVDLQVFQLFLDNCTPCPTAWRKRSGKWKGK